MCTVLGVRVLPAPRTCDEEASLWARLLSPNLVNKSLTAIIITINNITIIKTVNSPSLVG